MGESIMITHGLLANYGVVDFLIHEIKNINEFDAVKSNKKVNWKQTDHKYNPNAKRKRLIFQERWR